MKVLSAYYDLKVAPTTYDITSFLALAEMWRLHHGFDKIDLFVVANDTAHGYRENEIETPKAQKDWMLHHVLLQCHVLLNSCRRAIYVSDRKELSDVPLGNTLVFPFGYTPSGPNPFYLLKEITHFGLNGFPEAKFEPTHEAVQKMRAWLEPRASGKRVVTITIRNSRRQPERNSNIDAWVEFAETLNPERYLPVFLPDTEALFSRPDPKLDAFECCTYASLCIDLRMALYDAAYMNLLINNGPNNLLIFNPNSRYIQFRPCTQGENTKIETLAKNGFTASYDAVLRNSFQSTVLDTDEFANIYRHFKKMETCIDSSIAPVWDEWPSPDVWMHRFANHGAFDDSLKVLELLLKNSEDPHLLHAEYNALLANAAANQIEDERFGAALAALNILTERLPTNIEIGMQRLMVLLRLGYITEMVEEFERLEGLGADLSSLFVVWGQALLAVEAFELAQSKFETYLSKNRDNIAALEGIAEAQRELGNADGYKVTLETLLTRLAGHETEKISQIQSILDHIKC